MGSLSQAQARGLASLDLSSGLALPIRSERLEAVVYAADIPNLSTDHLAQGEVLIDDLEQLAEGAAYLRALGEATEARVRVNLARDLHDSVAQFLAGVSFRLEAMKRANRPLVELRADIEGFQDELAAEQLHLRELISELRHPRSQGEGVLLAKSLSKLSRRLADQWQIELDCLCEDDIVISLAMDGELRQMIREAVANAVRHGRADRVQIHVALDDRTLCLDIADNGSGLPGGVGKDASLPRSLEERSRGLGGSMKVASNGGTRIEVRVPIGAAS